MNQRRKLVRLTEADLNNIIRESVENILAENAENEGFWGGVGNAISNTFKNTFGNGKSRYAGNSKQRQQNAPSMMQNFQNGKVASDLKNVAQYLQKYGAYLQRMGVQGAAELGQQIGQISQNLMVGGRTQQRGADGKFGKWNQNVNYTEE